MSETVKARISRLQGRRQELLERVRMLRGGPSMRNTEFKVARVNDEVRMITNKIAELKGET